MGTPHEELCVKMRQAGDACAEFRTLRLFDPPLLPFGKKARKFDDLKTAAGRLESEYVRSLKKVLKEQHGIAPADIVEVYPLYDGSSTHELWALVGRKVRRIEVRGIGNRVVFFLNGVALGKNDNPNSLKFKAKKIAASIG